MQYLLRPYGMLFTFILVLCTFSSDIPECIADFKSCCEGYIWNSKTNSCEVCTLGYTGQNCSEKCPFPTYGKRCQKLCKCNQDQCDVSEGCNSLFDKNTSFSSFSTDTSGFVILNENGTSLIPKTVVSSIYTRTKSSTGNTIILVLIKITGGVGATLVFVNIFLCLHHHCERKRSISSHKKVSNTTL